MRGRHEHEHSEHGKQHSEHHRKRGGRAKHHAEGGEIKEAGGNPYVEAEAHEKKRGGKAEHEGKHRKKGGKAEHEHEHHGRHRRRGGKAEHEHERKRGGHVVEGHHAKHRLDRPGRKRGGGVGADTSPLSSAHHDSSDAGKQPRTQEGGMST